MKAWIPSRTFVGYFLKLLHKVKINLLNESRSREASVARRNDGAGECGGGYAQLQHHPQDRLPDGSEGGWAVGDSGQREVPEVRGNRERMPG